MSDRGPFRLVPYFSSIRFDRAVHLRADEARLEALKHDPATRFVVLWRDQHLMDCSGTPALARLQRAALGLSETDMDECAETFLGHDERGAVFGLDLSALDAPPAFEGHVYRELRPDDFFLEREDAAIAAQFRGLAGWRAAHRFSGASGLPTAADRSGYRLTSPDGGVYSPHIDPVAVVLPVHGDRVLLAKTLRASNTRQMWALSAAVEPGETVEQTAARQVLEQLGLRAARLQYHSSQPWPFPNTIMMGFHLLTENTELVLDTGEIAEARWFSRDEVFAHADLGFDLPDPRTLAGHLLKRWMKCGDMFGNAQRHPH